MSKTLKIGLIMCGQILLVFAVMWVTSSIFNSQVRQELRGILKNDVGRVKLNDQSVDGIKSNSVIKALSNIKSAKHNNTRPSDRIKIELTSNGKAEVIYLDKDSGIDNEYWVYWEKYETSTLNDIGRITTDIFK